METRFGHDFGEVRVHADARASESARALNALAYTVGQRVVFGEGRYRPDTASGRRLLAHELAHTIQQRAGGRSLARQCDPAWAGLDWSTRVANVRGMANGSAKDQCMADMIDEALWPSVTVHERTNGANSVTAAITAGRYDEWNTLSDLRVNFDRNLNAKTGNLGQFGEAQFRTPPGGNDIEIFIVLGPNALDPVGPQHTQMALDHETEHAWDYLSQFALIGAGPPHGATAGEELAIYAEGFSRYFLELWDIDNTAGTFSISNTFPALFDNYAAADPPERDSAFDSIELFYDVRIQPIACNTMKFKIWLQMMMNARPANDPLVQRLNALPDMGLTKGDQPRDHFDSGLACT